MLESKVAENLHRLNKSDSIILAVSGGMDSCGLLHVMRRLGCQKLLVVHFDHQIRQTSFQDVLFVQQLASKYNINSVIGYPVKSIKNESDARKERYNFLLKVAKENGLRIIMTAHHADDQVETVLHNILRGTGFDGLAGIPMFSALDYGISLIRPFLNVRRVEIETYLLSLGYTDWIHDETNDSMDFTRNKIRKQLLPMIRNNIYKDADDAILRLADLAKGWKEVSEATLSGWDIQISYRANSVSIPLSVWESIPIFWRGEIIKKIWRKMDWPARSLDTASIKRICAGDLSTTAGGIFVKIISGSMTFQNES